MLTDRYAMAGLTRTIFGAKCQPLFSESFEGYVTEVVGDRVTVVYETDDDEITHHYERSQFEGGNLPRVGQRIATKVFVVARHPAGSAPAADRATTMTIDGGTDDAGELIREPEAF
jgi:hypothetical protein